MGDKRSKALDCATATTGWTFAQTPVVSSSAVDDAIQKTPKSIATELEEIVTPVNTQHLNN